MKDFRMLNDNELEMVNGGEIQISNAGSYTVMWYVEDNGQGYNINTQHEEYQDR